MVAPLLAGLALLVLTQSKPVDDAPAKARALIEAVAAAMKESPAIAFESTIGTKVQGADVRQKAKVLLARPDRARVELSGAGQDALIVLDGKTAWHYVKSKKGIVESPQLGTQKLEPYGAGILAPLFFEQGAGSLLPYLDEATVTEETLGREVCAVVAWSVGTEETRVWIVGDRVRRCRTTRSIAENRFEQTIEPGVVDLAPAIAPDAFTFVAPPGAQPLSPGDDSVLLAVGSAAPVFAATYLDGKPMQRSDFAGKPLLLTFWFYGCAPCREELPRLQRLNDEYAKRGVAMLAIDYGDQPETIAAYFAKAKLTLTPLRQSKDAMSQAFGVRTYPTTYVIDADGKVAWRALGYDEAALRAVLDRVAPAR